MMLSIATLQIQQQCSLTGWLNWSTSWSVHLEPWMMEKLQIVGLSYDENQHHFTSLIVLCVNVLSLYYHVMILLMYCRITHEASGDTAEVKVYSVFCLFLASVTVDEMQSAQCMYAKLWLTDLIGDRRSLKRLSLRCAGSHCLYTHRSLTWIL